jgi:hypothetical protein
MRSTSQAIPSSCCSGAQQLEDVHWDLLVGCTLDNSTGDQLDQWGDIVGEPRGGLEDWDYRVFIKARIMANRCTGTLDELIRIFQIVTAPSVVTSKEIYPKHLTLRAYRDCFMDAPRRGRVHAMMTAIHPAGTFLQIEEYTPASMRLSGSPRLETGLLSRLI